MIFLMALMSLLVNSQISPVDLMMQVNTFSVSLPYSVINQTEARPFGVSTSRWLRGS